MKIYIDMDMNMPEEEKPEDEEAEWPVKPFEEERRRVQILELNLYDGASVPDPSQEDGYAEAPLWTLNETEKSSDTASASPFSYTWYGNERSINADDIEDYFDQDVAGERNIWDHKKLKFIEENDKKANDDVLPVGVEYPDMEITVIAQDGTELDATSYQPYFAGSCDGEIKENSQECLQYRWNPSPYIAGHLKVEEKTSCSRMTQWQIYFEETKSGADIEYSDFYGLFWCPFDTSDRDNYKVTEEPRYDSLENTDPPIEVFGTTQYDLFLFPRFWGFWVEFFYSNSFIRAFIWTRPPKDFRMPVARRSGMYECAVPYTNTWFQTFPDFADLDFDLTEDNRHCVVEWQGDADYRNCLFLMNPHDIDYVGAYPYSLEYPDTLCCIGTPDKGKPFRFEFEYDSDIGDYWRPHIPEYRSSWESLSGWDKMTAWWNFRSPPDGKVIQMENQATLGPHDGDLECGNGMDDYYFASDTYYYHDEDDYDEDETAKIAALLDFVMDHPVIQGWGFTTAQIRAWGVFMGAGNEGDLVGILKRGTNIRYIWRRTDETIYYSGAEHTYDPYNWYEGVRAMAFTQVQFDPGDQIEVNLHGDLQMTWTAQDEDENTVIGRKLKNNKWGNYASYNVSNESAAVTTYLDKFDTGGEAHLFLYFQNFDKYI